MPLTKVETKVTWGTGSPSASVTPGGSQESDIVTLDDTCVAARISLKADNSSTPNAADIIRFRVLETMGDPDGSGADEYATEENGVFLAQIDTAQRDPGIKSSDLPIPQKSLKIYAEGITSSTVNAITVSATITEHRSS